MFKPHPLNDIVQLNIHPKIIGIQFQVIAFKQSGGLIYIHNQIGYITMIVDTPMAIFDRIGPKIYDLGHAGSPFVVWLQAREAIGGGKRLRA
jgi:hypothetical protein